MYHVSLCKHGAAWKNLVLFNIWTLLICGQFQSSGVFPPHLNLLCFRYSYMIDNIILLITGTLHQRPINELISKCHPLGSFEQMEAIHIASTPAELYNAVLVDTPLGIFSVSFSFFVERGWRDPNYFLCQCTSIFKDVSLPLRWRNQKVKSGDVLYLFSRFVLFYTFLVGSWSLDFSTVLCGLHQWAGFGRNECGNYQKYVVQGLSWRFLQVL